MVGKLLGGSLHSMQLKVASKKERNVRLITITKNALSFAIKVKVGAMHVTKMEINGVQNDSIERLTIMHRAIQPSGKSEVMQRSDLLRGLDCFQRRCVFHSKIDLAIFRKL